VAASPFFTFTSVVDGVDVRYATDDGSPGPLPDDATLTVPGADFPALVDYPLPNEPAVPVRLLPNIDLPIFSSSEYAWMPGGERGYLVLDFLAYDADQDFIDFAIVCRARDDGSFTLPAEALSEIDAIADKLRLRVDQQIESRDDITIVSRVPVAE